jgi:hypothetical protein
MTTESYQRLPCILCMLHGVEGSVGAFGPYNCIAESTGERAIPDIPRNVSATSDRLTRH